MVIRLSLILFLFSAAASGQSLKFRGPDPNKAINQYIHEAWQTDNGLPQNSIDAIRQTKDGFLWLGTQEGLVRFDGVQFTVYDKTNTPEIQQNHIVSLTVDADGVLWIATQTMGVLTYANNRFSKITNIPQIEHTQLRHLYKDFNGAIWIATRDSGIVKIQGSDVTHYSTGNRLINNNVWSVAQDMQKRIWVGTENGVSVIDGDTLLSFSTKDGLASRECYALLGDHSGEMWIGGTKGLQKARIESGRLTIVKHYTKNDGLAGPIIYKLITDQQGSMWIGTTAGVSRFYKERFDSFTEQDGLTSKTVNTLFVDREGNLWIGTEGGGLNVLRDGIFTSFTKKQGLPNNNIWNLFEDRNKQLWICTDEGIALFDPKSGVRKIFGTKEGLANGLAWTTAQDSTGAVWVGTGNGLNKIVNEKIIPLSDSLSFRGISVTCVYSDRRGVLWIGTAGSGLYTVGPGGRRAIGAERGMTSRFINVITSDRSGNIVIGTDGDGIFILQRDSVVAQYTTRNALASNYIYSLYVDSLNNIWSGSLGQGLSIYDRTSFHTFTTANGMFDDVVFQILEDNHGRIWLSCNKGIFHINKSDFFDVIRGVAASLSFTVYGKENGMGTNECNGGTASAGVKSSDGRLWFPTPRGIAMVNPDKISLNSQPPLVVIENLFVNNQPAEIVSGLVLPSGMQRYEFRYTGLSFDGPKKVQFKVKLEGYDKEWDNVKERRAAYYSYLPPGEYTFKVIAANSDGVWNVEGASFSFVVESTFYESKTFYILLAAAMLLLAYGFYRWRIRQIQLRQQALKHSVEVATKNLTEANKAKSQLLSFVAHDLKTPLITINSIAQEIKSLNVDSRFRGYLDLVEQNSKRIVTLISEILNISAIESGKFHFTFEPLNMADLAGMVVDGYQMHARRKNQTLTYSVKDRDACGILADASKLQEAFENIVNNAIKYSPRGAAITVTTECISDRVRFSVTDQGPGISDSEKEQMFQKFTVLSAKPTGGEIATGLGLAIVKEIVEAHKGKIFVESEPPKGSTFIIELPKHDAETAA